MDKTDKSNEDIGYRAIVLKRDGDNSRSIAFTCIDDAWSFVDYLCMEYMTKIFHDLSNKRLDPEIFGIKDFKKKFLVKDHITSSNVLMYKNECILISYILKIKDNFDDGHVEYMAVSYPFITRSRYHFSKHNEKWYMIDDDYHIMQSFEADDLDSLLDQADEFIVNNEYRYPNHDS